MITFRVEGGDVLASSLRELSDRVGRKVLLDALHEAAEPVVSVAATAAPKGDPKAPNLYQSIVASSVRGGGPFEATVAVGPTRDVFYAFFLEFGTRKMSAKPFMRPAIDQSVEGAIARLSSSLWDAIARRGVGSSRSTGGTGLL